MKKVLIVAVALASVNAFGSRARMAALSNSPHLIDSETIHNNPADMMVLADFVNFESGTTTNAGAQNANAEGMITRSMGDSKFGLSLGHLSSNASVWGLRSTARTGITNTISQQNPIALSYGMKMDDMNIAGTLVYSNYNDKAAGAEVKESTSGLRLGMRNAQWDARLGIGLGNTFEKTVATVTSKFKGTGGLSGAVGYAMDDMYYNLTIDQSGFKTEVSGVEDRKFDIMTYSIGALKSVKKDGSELFYGVALANSKTKLTTTNGTVTANDQTNMSLPVTLGMEVDAATWMTLRGSLTQNVLISKEKNDITVGGSDLDPGANTTAAKVGAGLKFGKLTIDATFSDLMTSGTNTQTINGNNLFAMVGVTYLY